MADLYGLPKTHIVPDMSAAAEAQSGKPALRPMNCQLDTEETYNLLKFKAAIDFKAEIKDCLENFVQI